MKLIRSRVMPVSPMLDVRPFGPSTFGAEIHGLDLRGELPDEVVGGIVDALYAHRLVVIRDQRLDERGYVAFGRRLGRPEAHALDHLRMPGYPEIEPIGNVNDKDRDEAVRNGAAFWHTDQAYEAVPASMIVLYTRRMPRAGGETLVADMCAAYDDLDADTRTRIDSLVVRHAYQAAQGGAGEERAIPIRTDEQRTRLPPVRHHLAPPHPVTGRRSLYAVAGFAYGIEGMADEEAKALLDELKAHALRPRYVRKHRHAVGDVMVLDTLQTLHAAIPLGFSSGEHDARLLWRLGIKGAPPIRAQEWRPSEPQARAVCAGPLRVSRCPPARGRMGRRSRHGPLRTGEEVVPRVRAPRGADETDRASGKRRR